MILAIEREWNRYPGWLATLPPDQQATLIAEHETRRR
jgi:hypothetical protein